jgi:hypothetical protein
MSKTTKKAIFSIACTTCQARLAIFSETAVGQILECPKCHSLVQIAPPADWKPAVAPALESQSGPPPLGRVAAGAATVDLDLAEPPQAGFLARKKFQIIWFAVFLMMSLLVVALWQWFASSPGPASGTKPTIKTPPIETKNPVKEPAASGSTAAAPAPKVTPAVPPAVSKTAGTASERLVNSKSEKGVKDKKGEKSEKSVKDEKDAKSEAKKVEEKDKQTGNEKTGVEKKKNETEKTNGKENKNGNGGGKPTPSIEFKKLPPPQVDVAARMRAPLRELELTDTPLIRAFDLLAALGGSPITLDPDAMRQLGVGPQDRVSVKLASTTLGQALQAVAEKRGLAVTTDGQIVITSPDAFRETPKKVRYAVADLTGDDRAAAEQLAAMVRRFIAPESWHVDAVSQKSIAVEPGALVVTQTADMQQQVLAFCEKLRTARQKPLRSREKLERFSIVTRTSRASKLLYRPMTVNFHEPTPLAKILAYLADAAGCTILIDRTSLAAAETSDRVETSLTVQRNPLAATLADLLAPLGLAYRVVDDGVIQVTTREAVEERLELEFFPVASLLIGGETPDSLIKKLKAAISPSSWNDAGGLGDIFYDAPSKHFILLQSQPVQAAVERWLNGKK